MYNSNQIWFWMFENQFSHICSLVSWVACWSNRMIFLTWGQKCIDFLIWSWKPYCTHLHTSTKLRFEKSKGLSDKSLKNLKESQTTENSNLLCSGSSFLAIYGSALKNGKKKIGLQFAFNSIVLKRSALQNEHPHHF